MAFDFPSAPAVGDTFEEGGIKYIWSGTAWDLFSAGPTDYVLKAGDTMTGNLIFDVPATDNADITFHKANASRWVFRHAPDANGIKGPLEIHGVSDNNQWYKYLTINRLGDWDIPYNVALASTSYKVTLRGQMTFGAVVGGSLDDFSKHLELYSGANGMGIGTSTGGQFNFILKHVDHAFNFRVATVTQVQINKNGLGPRATHNVSFQNGFTGTMDFRVNPAMVTMRILNVKSTNAQVGTTQHVKICDYPAAVPAPWGNLYVHVEGCSDTAFTFLGRHAMVSCQTGGVFLSMYGGSTPEDFPANTYFTCTISWSR